ncbi:MAG: hypothetical protein WBH73_08215, partial [Arcanobacterium sp.]
KLGKIELSEDSLRIVRFSLIWGAENGLWGAENGLWGAENGLWGAENGLWGAENGLWGAVNRLQETESGTLGPFLLAKPEIKR